MNQPDKTKYGVSTYVDLFWRQRWFRFLFIGGMNTLLAYAIYAFFLFLGLNYALANLASLIIGILISFKTQGTFVFNNPNNNLFWRYILFWVVLYVMNIALIAGLMSLGLDAYLSGALAIPPITLTSYLAQKYLVFRRPITL